MVFWTTRVTMLRTFGVIRRNWHKVSREFFFGEPDAKFALRAMRRMERSARKWSAPSDLARVEVSQCRAIGCLRSAVEKAMPNAAKTIEEIGHIADAAAIGRVSNGDERAEVYQRTRDGWECVAEMGKADE